MSEADLKINSKVRRILTEQGLDLSALSVSSASGAVTIQGELRKLTQKEIREQDIARLLNVLETVILRTKDIKRVAFSVKGWKKSKGKWEKDKE